MFPVNLKRKHIWKELQPGSNLLWITFLQEHPGKQKLSKLWAGWHLSWFWTIGLLPSGGNLVVKRKAYPGRSKWVSKSGLFFLLRDSPIFELSPKVGFQNVENCWNHVASLQFPSLRSWNIYCKKCNLNFCWSCFPSGNPPDGEFPAGSWGEIFTPCFPSSLPFMFSTVLFIVPWH